MLAIAKKLMRQIRTKAQVRRAFDAEFYASQFEPGLAPADPFEHFMQQGWREERDPNEWFSVLFYLGANADVKESDINPFVHYLQYGRAEGRAPRSARVALGDMSQALLEQQKASVAPGPLFENFDPTLGEGNSLQAKAFAYYLPQFHAIPENDEFWGKGFTEWRNVARGLPRFAGHVQPRLPADLGFYDLSDPEVMRRQIEMAQAAGLFGWCFYYYWFGGKRVLEKPIEHLLGDETLDMPFTIMWANENWTRIWDGLSNDILLGQDYSESNDVALVDDLARYFKDKRYFKINGRPLFFIYRPGQIPDTSKTIGRWRALLKTRHQMDPLFFMAQGFGDTDPRPFGLDGAIEFPPHKLGADLPNINADVTLFDNRFSGYVQRYDDVVQRSADEIVPDFPLIRTTFPSWDNEARRQGSGMVMHGSTPQKFGAWMQDVIGYAKENPVMGETIVCVNAWNEWAEGAYLEPDLHYGGAYLNALSRAVHGIKDAKGLMHTKVVIVGHDAYRHGAQMLVANLARTMLHRFGVEVVIVLCSGGGDMLPEYQALCETHTLSPGFETADVVLKDLVDRGFTHAIANTTVSGRLIPKLKAAGFHVTSLIHELPVLIHEYGLEDATKTIVHAADRVVFPAKVVADSFVDIAGNKPHEMIVRSQGLYRSELTKRAMVDGTIHAELGLSETCKIVLNAGYGDHRKGIDLFIKTAEMFAHDPDVQFIWLGAVAQDMGNSEHVVFPGMVDDVDRWYAAADLFYLSAREDPFPSVVLEALAMGLPVIGFKGVGGCDDLIAQLGELVAFEDLSQVAGTIKLVLSRDEALQQTDAHKRRAAIVANHSFDDYCRRLITIEQT